MKHYKILLLLCSMLYTTNVSAQTKQQLANKNAICWGFYSQANMLRVQNSKQKAEKYYDNVQYLGYHYGYPSIMNAYNKGTQLFGYTRGESSLNKVKMYCAEANSSVIFISHI